ncbi:zinc finger protein-like 1 [Coturnix japonica]|uniref:zinc finger protein-like 1 n=1 Tax=Coturnix japonica TaxID=93934 RepID=UPI0007770C09|nr:zinc finger protein-like 1 [Coturnix japonica]
MSPNGSHYPLWAGLQFPSPPHGIAVPYGSQCISMAPIIPYGSGCNSPPIRWVSLFPISPIVSLCISMTPYGSGCNSPPGRWLSLFPMYLNGSHYPLWIWLQFPSRPLGVAVADLFHWRCLSTRYVSLPPHTAPSGFRCPSCNAPLFPPPESRGPVADALRSRLANVAWARPGLGLPLIADADVEPEPSDGSEWGESSDPPAAPEPPPSPELPSTHTVVHMGGGESLGLHGSAPRKALWGRENRTPPPQNNQEDDKYRRRPHGGGLPHRIRWGG